jgi:hypothetical protein
VFVACIKGKETLQTLLQVNSKSNTTTLAMKAKDKITVSVSQTSTSAKVVVTDLTTKGTQSMTGAGGKDSTSNIGTNAITIGGASVGNPKFGTLTYSSDRTNGAAIGTLPHTAYNEATATTGGTLRILTSALNTAGNSFTATYKHA